MNKKDAVPARTGLEVAIIGMAGRFPGAPDVRTFWENIKNGVESITFFSGEELVAGGVDPQLLQRDNYVKAAAVVEGIEYFDASFFDYTPREAEIMHPQLRLFLECSWQALEDAGYAPGCYNGPIGVYAGASSSFYWEGLVMVSGKGEQVGHFAAAQLAEKDYLSTLVSYKLDLKGPSLVMQSACSTSLSAVHTAARAVLSGECAMALAGGVTVSERQGRGYLYEEGMIYSPDGHCRAFDRRAGGTVGGNGAAVVVLKRLKEALKDRDPVYAVIKGSALNNDGKRKVGFSAPSVEGQADVIHRAMAMARVKPTDISYIETHGTGTPLGDPVEIEALKLAFKNTGKKNSCAIGSVKTNIGHLSAAAGTSGLIKTVLALAHEQLPPSLHFQHPNPKIDFQNSPFYVNTGLAPWPAGNGPRRAGVSSFGIGGTNAHIILEEAPPPAEAPETARPYQLLTLSAKDSTALRQAGEYLAAQLDRRDTPLFLADAAYTLHVGRGTFKHRRAAVAASPAEAAQILRSPAAAGATAAETPPPVVFMFSGQGSQYVGMGRELYRHEPLFRQEIDRCAGILQTEMNADIRDILYPANPGEDAQEKLNDVIYSGPVKFSFEYALARLLQSWGIIPRAMIGHSFGEFVTAHLAGVFSLEDALRLVVLRGQLMGGTSAGAMMSVPLPEEELRSLLPGDVSLAAVNTPSLCIVSGSAAAVDSFEQDLAGRDIECLRLNFPRGSHSRMMEPIFQPFKDAVARVHLEKPEIPYIAGLTGNWITAAEAVDPAYWARHFMETVHFSAGVEKLLDIPGAIFIQVGCDRGLPQFVGQHMEEDSENLLLNLVRHPKEKIADTAFMLDKIGTLWCRGVYIDWTAFHAHEQRARVHLPTYPFQRQRYWMDHTSLEQGLRAANSGNALQRNEDLSRWFYVPSWERTIWRGADRQPGTHADTASTALVFTDPMGTGAGLIEALRADGKHVVTVHRGQAFQAREDGVYTLNPSDEDHYDRLFRELKEKELPPGELFHLWGITGTPCGDMPGTGEEFAAVLDTGFYSLLYIARASHRENLFQPLRIAAVTTGLFEVTGEEELEPAKAAILGAVKVIPHEYPHIDCRGIDIPPLEPGSRRMDFFMRHLAREFSGGYSGRLVAYRGGRRWAQTFTPSPVEAQASPSEPALFKEGGVYLVTGGSGGIGLSLAQYLAGSVRANIVLIARTSPADYPEATKEKIRQMEASGTRVLPLAADVSDPGQMEAAIHRVVEGFGPINGVIHSAGLADGGVIQLRTRAGIDAVLASKLAGTRLLERLTEGMPVDFFVLCSSLASVFEPAGQVAYCAANAFLDAYAHYNTAKGGPPTVSINWDTWKGVGMALEAVKALGPAQRDALFMNAMSPDEGNEAFARCLRLGQPQVAVSTRDLPAQLEAGEKTGQDSLAAAGVTDHEREHEPEQAPANAVLYQRPRLNSDYVPPENPVEQQLTDIWRHYFGIDRIGVEDDFFELGGDSLKAFRLGTEVHRTLDVKIPISEFFNRPTLKELAQYIAAENGGTSFVSIPPAEKKEYYALSSAQKRLYALFRMEPANISYNVSNVKRLRGNVDPARFEEIFKTFIERHESLRTSFTLVDREPVQRVWDTEDTAEFKLEYHRLDPTEETTRFNSAVETYIRNFVRPFDLAAAPLLRVGILETGPDEFILMVDMHHIISDGISYTILINDFISLYNDIHLTPLPLQYKDYAQWLHREQDQGEIEKQETYWMEHFSGCVSAADLPLDFPRSGLPAFDGDSIGFPIADELYGRLEQLINEEKDTTLFMALLAIFNVLLARYAGGGEHITVGSPTAGRGHADLGNIIGMFVNMLVFRNSPGPGQSFREFLREVTQGALRAYENQDYPYDQLIEKLEIPREPGRNPLFDSVFSLQKFDLATNGAGTAGTMELEILPFPFRNSISRFDLQMRGIAVPGGLTMEFDYKTALFRRETIENMKKHYLKIIEQVLAGPDTLLQDIQLLSPEEKHRLLVEFNDTAVTWEQENQTVISLFEDQAARFPDNLAVVCPTGGGEITYLELLDEVHRTARRLTARGAGRQTVVAVNLGPSIQMIVALLAVLKSGAAYLPIHPDWPRERLRYVLLDSSAVLLLTSPSHREVDAADTPVMHLESGITREDECPGNGSAGTGEPVPGDPAYVIYTSGTTGKPKGVVLEHRNLVNYTRWLSGALELVPDDRTVMTASFAFDLGYSSLYGALLTGGQLHLPSRDQYTSADTLLRYIEEQEITFLKITPSLFSLLAGSPRLSPGVCAPLRVVLLGGEGIITADVERVHRVAPHIRFMNHYGPTEATIGCIARFIDFEDFETYKAAPTIGGPIANTSAFILDGNLGLVPPGIPGELLISGAGLARGYLNRPQLTAEKFVFPGTGSSLPPRLYKTGDLARREHDGSIRFLGRIDQQVKIRGLRIEPDEIRGHLLKHTGLEDAAVIARANQKGDMQLYAYVVPAPGQDIAAAELEAFLSEYVPAYMIPPVFVTLEHIPLTPNGKLDRKSLPDTGVPTGLRPFAPPRDGLESQLADLWSRLLGEKAESIGIDDNFFHLGGHSLKATILADDIHRAFDVRIPMADMFKKTTIRRLAQAIRGGSREEFFAVPTAENREYYPLSSAQKRLYFMHLMAPDSTTYNTPTIMKLEGTVDKDRLEQAFLSLVKRHESLRTRYIMLGDEAVQQVREPGRDPFEIEYLEAGPGELDEHIIRFVRPFDMSHAPLIRVALIEETPRRHTLLIDIPHIIRDAVSRGIMERDFNALYAGEPLPPLRLQYKDFALWQVHRAAEGAMALEETYWLNRFEQPVLPLDLPTDYPRPLDKPADDGDVVDFTIDASLTRRMHLLEQESGATTFMVLLSVYNILLSKYSGREDIVVGSPVTGRRHSDLRDILGMFVNMMAMRSFPAGDKTFLDFLGEVKQYALEAYENQNYQFDDLVRALGLQGDSGRNPLFEVVLDMHLVDAPAPGTGDEPEAAEQSLVIRPYRLKDIIKVPFDLIMRGGEQDGVLHMSLLFSANLFKREKIERMTAHFVDILGQVLGNTSVPLRDITVDHGLAAAQPSIPIEEEGDFTF